MILINIKDLSVYGLDVKINLDVLSNGWDSRLGFQSSGKPPTYCWCIKVTELSYII
jgi:hypothetical protein